jgi:superfamily II DNA or RNA helicase
MAKPIIQIAFNPVTAKLVNSDTEADMIVSSVLSYEVEGYEHSDAYKSGNWDGISTFFTYMNRTFPAGFVKIVEKRLKANGYRVQLARRPLPEPLGSEEPEVDDFGFDPRYDYQMETVRQLEKRGMMIARVATGGGKSRIAKLCTARIGRKTLFITTRRVLMHQMRKDYLKSGMDCGIMGDGEWIEGENLNCAMVQTLAARLKMPDPGDESAAAIRQRRVAKETRDFLSTVEFVIGEEAHEASGHEYFDILKHCKNAPYRLALTGTPFLRPSAEANMRLMAAFGQIGIEVSEKLLIDRGILATPKFMIANQSAPAKLRTSTPWQRAVELGIVENIGRNKEIVEQILRANKYGLTSMVLVQRKKHGSKLKEMLEDAGLRVQFIYGDSTEAIRQKALEKLGSGELDVLIGTTILDVGVDVPAVGMVVLAGGGKAEVALRQRIGRGLRAKKNGPNYCFILDFHDEHNKHLRKHALTRQSAITSTPGFKENVLKKGEQFDFDGLGFTAT